ncbi:MAG: M20/M25/M40 family metallo-hydrolase, partial [Bacteroidales bacterium]
MKNILPALSLFLVMFSMDASANKTENEFLANSHLNPVLPDNPGYGSFAGQLNDYGNRSLAERLKDHVAVLASDSLEGRGLGTRGKVIAKNYIAGHFHSFGLIPVDGDYFQNFEMRVGLAWVQGSNVIGYLKGADPDLQSEFIVIGAHYDHLGYEDKNGQRIIYPGADDNASGTASLIELARYFSQNREKMGRSIIFIAFDAEESGLIGSEKFLNMSEAFGKNNIKAMFSLDMVGMYGVHSGLDMKGMGAVDGGVEMAECLAEEYNINLKNTSAEMEYR